MAVPDRSPEEMTAVLHTADVGFSQQGFSLVAKTQIGGAAFLCEVTKGPRTWYVDYGVAGDGTPGKLYRIIDDEGRLWFHDPKVGNSWNDGGVN